MEEKERQAAGLQPQEEALPDTEIVSAEDLLAEQPPADAQASQDFHQLKSLLEAIVYVLNEPMTLDQISQALDRPPVEVKPALDALVEETRSDSRGILVREVAGGYQMATKPEHHEVIRQFVRNLKQPLKLSQAALETLAVIAYKQPITAPEIIEIRGVQGAGVLKTLLDRKLITTAGRKNVIGKPILYKTTKDFLTQFGLKDLAELPTLKEFEELKRQSISDEEPLQPELALAAEEETFKLEQQADAPEPPAESIEPADEPSGELTSDAADTPPEDPR